MPVADRQAHHARGKIEILIAIDIDDGAGLAFLENDAGRITPAENMLGVARDQVLMGIGEVELLFDAAPLIERRNLYAVTTIHMTRRHGNGDGSARKGATVDLDCGNALAL